MSLGFSSENSFTASASLSLSTSLISMSHIRTPPTERTSVGSIFIRAAYASLSAPPSFITGLACTSSTMSTSSPVRRAGTPLCPILRVTVLAKAPPLALSRCRNTVVSRSVWNRSLRSLAARCTRARASLFSVKRLMISRRSRYTMSSHSAALATNGTGGLVGSRHSSPSMAPARRVTRICSSLTSGGGSSKLRKSSSSFVMLTSTDEVPGGRMLLPPFSIELGLSEMCTCPLRIRKTPSDCMSLRITVSPGAKWRG
mmetsp:Transcript_4313/g.8463  ORF Transcript_4313/g.8463 Transcript_4313/m.8463 type:complete len:257 (-) Transcript_4313:205-975(-)